MVVSHMMTNPLRRNTMKQFKPSQFNNFIVDNYSEHVIYNSYSGAIVKLNEVIYSAFKEVETNPNFEFVERDALVEQGLLIPYSQNEVEKVLAKQKEKLLANGDLLSLTIAPTLSCNFHCYYCFENGANHNEPEEFPIAETMKFIESKCEEYNYKKLYVKWFGGEPLIKKEVIFELAKRIKEYCAKKGIYFYSAIITNGYYLTPEITTKLVEYSNLRGIQVSIDGDSKCYCNAKATTEEAYNTVLDNIAKSSPLAEIHVRFNVSKENIDSIPTVIEDIKSRCSKCGSTNNVKFDIARVRDYSSLNSQNNLLSNYIINKTCLKDDFGYKYQSLKDRYSEEIPIKVRRTYCMERSASFYSIGPNGDLYKCPHFFGRDNTSIGNVATGESYNEFWNKYINKLNHPQRCLSCSMFAVCFSGCP